MEYIAYFATIMHTQIDYVENILKEYDIGSYLIGMEITKDSHKETEGQHMHFLVQMSQVDYHRFAKRIFVDKYKLRGKALKDKPRQYGKIKKIEDVEKMACYTVKDGNIRTNMSDEELQSYIDKSFKKSEYLDEQEKIFKYVDENFLLNKDWLGIDAYGRIQPMYCVGHWVIKYMKDNNIPRRKTKITNLTIDYLGKNKWTVNDEFDYFFS